MAPRALFTSTAASLCFLILAVDVLFPPAHPSSLPSLRKHLHHVVLVFKDVFFYLPFFSPQFPSLSLATQFQFHPLRNSTLIILRLHFVSWRRSPSPVPYLRLSPLRLISAVTSASLHLCTSAAASFPPPVPPTPPAVAILLPLLSLSVQALTHLH